MGEAQLPCCYVLGIETQIGLCLMREIGAAGVPVVGIAQSKDAIGLRSRYLTHGAVIEDPRSPDGIRSVRALGERYGAGYMLTVSEANVRFLIANRDAYGQIIPLVPAERAFNVVLNKAETIMEAARVGVDVPQSVTPRDMAHAAEIARKFRFPGVVKWQSPEYVIPLLRRHNVPLVKAEYVYTPEEFLAVARRYEVLNQWPLLQEYCVGHGLGLFFFMHKGEVVRRFLHRRVAEWPPEGGASSVSEAVPLSQFTELQDKCVAMLRNIQWEGVAMVEFRHDPLTGRTVLMEINGRYWGSFPLAFYSGAGFARLSYFLQGLGRMPDLPRQRNDIRCRLVGTEIKRLIRIILQPERIQDKSFQVRPLYELVRFVRDFFRPNVRYYLWSRDDPKPFFADLRNVILRRT